MCPASGVQVVRGLKRIIDDPTFTPDQVAKQSKAAMSMCLWVRAMDTYARVSKVRRRTPLTCPTASSSRKQAPHPLRTNLVVVVALLPGSQVGERQSVSKHRRPDVACRAPRPVLPQVVEPKREALRGAQAALDAMNAALAEKTAQLLEIEAKVEMLQAQLEGTQAELASLQQQADLSQKRLGRAEKLISVLGDESVRWKQTAEELGDRMLLLVGDVFLSSACISYMGAFTGEARDGAARLALSLRRLHGHGGWAAVWSVGPAVRSGGGGAVRRHVPQRADVGVGGALPRAAHPRLGQLHAAKHAGFARRGAVGGPSACLPSPTVPQGQPEVVRGSIRIARRCGCVQVREWNLQGLPTDSLSVDNGILVTRGSRWALMVDPQDQANR